MVFCNSCLHAIPERGLGLGFILVMLWVLIEAAVDILRPRYLREPPTHPLLLCSGEIITIVTPLNKVPFLLCILHSGIVKIFTFYSIMW